MLERPVDEFVNDDEAVYALRYAVVEFVEAAAQVGLLLTRRAGARPGSYGEVFDVLGDLRVISRDLAVAMRRFASLRNLPVHRYWEVDDRRMFTELKEGGVSALKKFIEAVERHV
jgi:uncharacterized protein YutE (UPF0331/DUF86 family)